MSMRDAAFAWAGRGFRVFPLQPNRKLPIKGVSWQALACEDEWQAHARWSQPEFANCNIGTWCVDLVVVDVDSGKHPEALKAYEALQLPQTLAVRTPSGGYHFYFRGPNLSNSASKLAKGIDTRGAGGYVVAPGSVTEAGSYHIWLDVPIAEAPEHLINRLRAARDNGEKRDVDLTKAGTPPVRLEQARKYLAEARVSVEGAGGNQTAFEVLAGLHDIGVYPADALELLDSWNDRCLPPWSDDELRTLLVNAYSYCSGEFGSRAADTVFAGVYVPPPATPVDDFVCVSAASWSEDIEPREWHVPGLLPKIEVTSLYGDGAAGKSLLAQQLALATALGGKWLDMDVEPGPAVYLSAEDSEAELKRRVREILGPHGGPFSQLRDLHFIPRAGLSSVLGRFDRDGALTTTGLWHKLGDLVDRMRPKLVVLDNLADIFSGNEIDKLQAREFTNLMRRLAMACNTTVLMLAHPSQAGLASGEGTSGNVAWNNSVRTRLYLERDPDNPRDQRILTVKKSNYSAQGSKFHMRWSDGRFVPIQAKQDNIAARKEIALLIQQIMLKKGWISAPIIGMCKELAAGEIKHPDAVLALQTSGSYTAVRNWLVSALAGGVRLDDGTLIRINEADLVEKS